MAVQPIDPAAIARFAGALECDDWQERLPQLDLVQESTFQDEPLSSVRTAVLEFDTLYIDRRKGPNGLERTLWRS